MHLSICINAQNDLKLPKGVSKDKIKFELANNLIVIPVELNGLKLSFLLDTGVSATVLFSIDRSDTLELKNRTKIYLKGFGEKEPYEAIKSVNNSLKIGKALDLDHSVYLIFDESMNFSPRMGFPIHGIIGYDFFKDFIVEINYAKNYLKIYDPKPYKYKKCKKCHEAPLLLRNRKPYVNAQIAIEDQDKDVKLLVDTGSGDAIWLFENEDEQIYIPAASFEDFLGKGLSGDIFGKRSKINSFSLGGYHLKEVSASYPDSLYTQGATFLERQGSIGGNILKRFNLILDYKSKKIRFKKNKRFSKPFFYNMAGLTIQSKGFSYIKKIEERTVNVEGLDFVSVDEKKGVKYSRTYNILYTLKPNIEVAEIRPDSPADLAGLQKGDLILEVNNRKTHTYKLSDLNNLFYSEEGKKIKIKIKRYGVEIEYVFYLKKVL